METIINRLASLQYKDEGNGYFSIKTSRGSLITNKQGVFIIDSIENNQTIEDIINAFSCTFDQGLEESQKYVSTFLYELQLSDLINIENDRFYNLKKDEEINCAGEQEYSLISKTIIDYLNKSNTIFCYSSDKRSYHKYIIRTKGFYNHENYFYSTNGDKIENIVGLQNLSMENQPIVICLLQYYNSFEGLVEFFESVISYLKKDGRYKIKLVVQEEHFNHQLKSFVDKLGFEREGYLKKEDGANNFIIFSKLI